MNENETVRFRKINPIYNAIDAHNYKGAIKLCQKKDIASWDISKSLMAYCLAKIGKSADSLSLAREVKENKSVDEAVLSALALTFKLLKADDDVTECYENAYNQLPEHDGFAAEVFKCYARSGNFKKMQQLSQKFYKSKGQSRYIFWSVSSMLHQSDLPVAMLDLCEKMILKIFDEKSDGLQPGAEELKLLVDTLRRKASHPSTDLLNKCSTLERCLGYIQNYASRPKPPPISDDKAFTNDTSLVKFHPTHVKLLSIDVLKELRKYQLQQPTSECSSLPRSETSDNVSVLMTSLLKEVLVELPDQWDALESLVRLHIDSCIDSEGRCDLPVICRFHEELKSMQSQPVKNRGPFLAEMLLLCSWCDVVSKAQGSPADLPSCWTSSAAEDDVTEAMHNMTIESAVGVESSLSASAQRELIRLVSSYMKMFDCKQCCFTDIKPYMAKLSGPAAESLRLWATHRAAEFHDELLRLAEADALEHAKDTSSTKDGDRSSDTNMVATLLCRLCKLLQVDYFLAITNGRPPSALTSPQSLLDIYCRTHAVGAGKCVGGLREVQPGDELLLLASTIMKKELMSCRLKSDVDEAAREDELTQLSLRWASLLQVGRTSSSHSYCFPLELLEPLRMLGCAEYALESFNSLSVKFIQLDSMPYIILPALYEGGLLNEANQLCRSIISFHDTSQRETKTMIANSFEFSNYAKGLELGEFLRKCQQSTQLALARAEYPILEAETKLHSPQDIATYLQTYIAGLVLESQSELSGEQLSQLVDNMDYDLLTRLEEVPGSSEEDQRKRIRRGQYEDRIKRSQELLRLVMHILQGDTESSTSRIDSLEASLFFNSSEKTVSSPVTWSQRICTESGDGYAVEKSVWEILLGVSRACVLSQRIAAIKKITAADSEKKVDSALVDDLQSTCELIRASVSSLHSGLVPSVESRDSLYLRTTREGQSDVSSPILRPSWIREVSYVVSTLGTWLPILLSHSMTSLSAGESTGGKKKKKKASKNDSSSSEEKSVMQGVIEAYKELTCALETILEEESQRHDSSVVESAVSAVRILSQRARVEDSQDYVGSDLTENCLKTAHVVVAEKLLSSQALTCSRLFTVLRSKKHVVV